MTATVDWQPILAAARTECPVGLWAKGIELAEAGAVAGAGESRGTWNFRVRVPRASVAPSVELYPEDEEWECDCDSRFGACEHVAACILAMAGGAATSLPASSATTLRYVLTGNAEGLLVERFLVCGGETTVVGAALAQVSGDAVSGDAAAAFTPTRDDIAVERILAASDGGAVPFARAAKVLAALVAAEDVRVADKQIKVSTEPLFPRARVVDDDGDGVQLTVETAPGAQVFAPGVTLADGCLRPFGAAERFGNAWEKLPLRRRYARRELADLVTRVLPELERHITVDVRSERLPRLGGKARPWLRFDTNLDGSELDVLPTVVYGEPPTARVDGERLVVLGDTLPERDVAAERNLVRRLRDELNLAPGRRAHFDEADTARFLAAMERFDDGRTGQRAFSVRERPRFEELTARLVGKGKDATVVFESGQASATAASVVAAWRDGLELVPTVGGGFARLPAGWLEQHGDLVADLLSAREAGGGRTPPAAAALLGDLADALDAPAPIEAKRLQALVQPDADNDQDGAPNQGFVGELRGYQSAGVAWLRRLRRAGLGGVLADDMGLGKTVQAVAVFGRRTLVVCPRSVIHNWAREAERFRPDLTVALYHGPRRKLDDRDDVVLTTYATLRNDIDTLAAVDWDAVVLDEAQAIKNPDAQAARAAYRLEAKFRLSLSGTPVENRLDELWSQMHFANRGLLGGRRDFVERTARPVENGDHQAAARLRRRVAPFLLRRLKRDVASELPPRTDAVLYCELDEGERDLYDAVRAASRADVVRTIEGGGGPLAVLEALLRLRQAACHSGLVPGHEAARSSKVDALSEALEDAVADGHKALVFSQWTSLLDRVEPHLRERDIAFTRLDGKTRDRAGVVDAFQADDGPPVLLVSLTAGGTGLNLTAADHVFLLDPWWNPAVEDQAADRAHRIGQDKPVMVYRMVAKDTVEERVLALQERKRALAAAALSDAESVGNATPTLTREDILELIS